MGYPNSEWVRPFVRGKIVDTIEQDATGEVWIRFDDGTALRLYAKVAQPITPGSEIIATPFDCSGGVVQSARILDTAKKK